MSHSTRVVVGRDYRITTAVRYGWECDCGERSPVAYVRQRDATAAGTRHISEQRRVSR